MRTALAKKPAPPQNIVEFGDHKGFEIVYECLQCDKTQTLRYFAHEHALPAVNCVDCGAGSGLALDQMIHLQKGMFPKLDAIAN